MTKKLAPFEEESPFYGHIKTDLEEGDYIEMTVQVRNIGPYRRNIEVRIDRIDIEIMKGWTFCGCAMEPAIAFHNAWENLMGQFARSQLKDE